MLKELHDLIARDDPGWPIVRGWIAEAKHHVEVLPPPDNEIYKSERWPGWEREIATLGGDEAFDLYPFLSAWSANFRAKPPASACCVNLQSSTWLKNMEHDGLFDLSVRGCVQTTSCSTSGFPNP